MFMFEESDNCAQSFEPMPYLDERFYLVSIFGSSVAAIAIVQNLLLLFMFTTRPLLRRSHFYYFTFMALIDLMISICFIAVIALSIVFEKNMDLSLMRAWYVYVIPVTTLSHIVLCASPYLLIAASVERYLTINWFTGICTVGRRFVAVMAVLVFSTLSKGTMLFELKVIHAPNCANFSEYYLEATDLMYDPLYSTVWCFWYRNIVTVFLPFILLLILNGGIVWNDYFSCIDVQTDRSTGKSKIKLRFRRRTHSSDRNFAVILRSSPKYFNSTRGTAFNSFKLGESNLVLTQTQAWMNRAKTRVRKSSTRALIALIIEYLVTNSLSFVITVWEHVDPDGIRLETNKTFYYFATDVISLLTIISCALRLPTYLVCDVTFRKEMKWMLFNLHCNKLRGDQSLPDLVTIGGQLMKRGRLGHKWTELGFALQEILKKRKSTGRLFDPPQLNMDLDIKSATFGRKYATAWGPGFSGVVLEALEVRHRRDSQQPSPFDTRMLWSPFDAHPNSNNQWDDSVWKQRKHRLVSFQCDENHAWRHSEPPNTNHYSNYNDYFPAPTAISNGEFFSTV